MKYVIPSRGILLLLVVVHERRENPESVVLVPERRGPYSTAGLLDTNLHLCLSRKLIPRRPVCLRKARELFRAVQSVSYAS